MNQNQRQNQNNANALQLQTININSLQEKCRSKKELYHFLTLDCGAFLPRVQATNIYFFKQIIRGIKDVSIFLSQKQTFMQYVKREQVKISSVPHIEGLTVDDFIQFASEKQHILKYLPDQRDWVHIDRQWLCDIIYTLETEGFQRKINEALSERKQRLEQSRNLLVEMRPEFVKALNTCLNFSHQKGRASNLLKGTSSRKRLRTEIEEVKQEEQELKNNRQALLQTVKRLKQDKNELEQQLMELSQANAQLAEFYQHEMQSQQQIQFQI